MWRRALPSTTASTWPAPWRCAAVSRRCWSRCWCPGGGGRCAGPPRHRRALLAIGALVAVQSLCLYSAVARLPVALALLAFNTYPLWTALWARVVYQHRPEPRVLRAMPVMLLGLALALDVL